MFEELTEENCLTVAEPSVLLILGEVNAGKVGLQKLTHQATTGKESL